MKNTILFFFLLLAAAVSAQSNSFVTDRLRAAEYFRIGSNTSQKVTGFDRVITAPAAHDSLPTSRAVVDFLQANFTPIGYYTAGDGISISDDVITNAAPDQVVGLTGGGISVITGTYPNFTITSNEVDGSTTNELQNLSLSGQSLSISSGTGVTLPVVGVSAGTGIGVSGSGGTFTVSNTGDLSNTNEIQTLSISGQNLSLSSGGGTVTIPGGSSLGTGFTNGGGSGTIPGATALLSGDFAIDNSGAYAVNLGDVNGASNGIGMRISDVTFQFGNPYGVGNYSVTSNIDGSDNYITIQSPDKDLRFDATGVTFSDYRTTKKGIEYAADYSAGFTDRSLVDKGYVDSHSGSSLGVGFTDGGSTGSLPDNTNAVIADHGYFQMSYSNSNPFFYVIDGYETDYSDSEAGFSSRDGTNYFGVKNNEVSMNAISGDLNFSIIESGTNATFTDSRSTKKGLEYGGDYSATIKSNARSIPDVGTVNILKQTLVSYTTTQRNAISSPAAGYIIYCSDCTATDSSTGVQQVWNGSTWKNCW